MLTAAIRDERSGEIVGVLVLTPKTFASGKTGYHGQAKLVLGGARYQAQAQLVAITTKGTDDWTDNTTKGATE